MATVIGDQESNYRRVRWLLRLFVFGLVVSHIVIAITFIGPLRDPVKNAWVVESGIIASILVIPWALIFGPLRGIPFWWRLIDCSFGAGGLVFLLPAHWLIRRMAPRVASAP